MVHSLSISGILTCAVVAVGTGSSSGAGAGVGLGAAAGAELVWLVVLLELFVWLDFLHPVFFYINFAFDLARTGIETCFAGLLFLFWPQEIRQLVVCRAVRECPDHWSQ